MSRNTIKIATILCVVALVACGALILGRSIFTATHYANAEKYTVGGATLKDAVKHLDVNWTDGSVTLAYHAKDTVEIAETAKKPISEGATLRWWLDGDTLRIQYAKSGYFSFFSPEKALTITLPEGVELGSVDINVTSGDVNVPELLASDVAIHQTSGDLSLKHSGEAERVALSSTSGDIRAEVGDVKRLSADVTSGEIHLALGRTDELSASTTSGDIDVRGDAAQKASLSSTSGKIGVSLAAFDALEIEATSGDITVALPAEPGYRADIHTTSGKFDYTVPLARDGDAYTCGDGSASLSIHVTSGDVRLTDIGE